MRRDERALFAETVYEELINDDAVPVRRKRILRSR
jgi:hypothetical protein